MNDSSTKALFQLTQLRPDLETIQIMSLQTRNLILFSRDSSGVESVWKVGPLLGSLACEVECLSRIPPHPNIVRMKGWWKTEKFIFVEYERAEGHCIVDLLVESRRFSEEESKEIIEQLVNALRFLHSQNWVHRDIKPDNMIWDRDKRILKLIDFEFACQFDKGKLLCERVGTFIYMSPEVKNHQTYEGPETEAWCLGITIFVFLTGRFPFITEDCEQDFDSLKPIILRQFSHEARDLISKLLRRDQDSRLTVEQILNHVWMKGRKENGGTASFRKRLQNSSKGSRLIDLLQKKK